MSELKAQKRSVAISMTAEERDAYLIDERVCRVASVGADGNPHVTPLWFIWDGTHFWLNSITLNPELAPIELAFARKYANSESFHVDGRHGWLRVTPTKITSWDFRKNPALRPPQ